ncbi:3-hydroxy-3-methylglutaryl-CoA reductase [Rhodobacterales bacterium HKCCE2091]|nr:3-hydroxy-3-methylglutaryl-CoA reductase [Rhodobacterales bacterium HKCCE2091]
MVVPFHVAEMLKRVKRRLAQDSDTARFAPRHGDLAVLRPRRRTSEETIADYHDRLGLSDAASDALADAETRAGASRYAANIENMIGTVKLPVGVIGPLRVNGLHAAGDYPVPLATTEAALVASYGRGALAANRAGGITTAVLYEGVLRTPAFVLDDLLSAGQFVDWVVENVAALQAAAEATTRYGRLVSVEPVIDTNIVFLLCRYTTGDAGGQNMVTIATDALCRHIAAHCPVRLRHWYVEGNFSGDKKASTLGTLTGRGRKVSASVVLPERVVESALRTSIDEMLAYGRVANLGALLSGQLGAQAHYANGLAALYIATGQDAACVAESAVGFTRMERHDGGLFASVTLPNILVGTVGGGTGLPTQSACLELMGLKGTGHAAALAEIAAALCLCGELSIVAAMAAGHFAVAHERLARQR